MSLFSGIKDSVFYGWIIVASCAIIGVIFIGVRFSFGVFFKSIESEFQLTRLATSSIVSLFMAFNALFAIVSGWALDKYGPRIVVFAMGLFTGLSLLLTSQASSLWQLFLVYSFLLSVGIGGAIPVLMSIASRWFDKKRGLALGIVNSGGALGPIIMVPFATFLIANLTWRTTYMVIGLIALLIVCSIALFLRNPAEIGVSPDIAEEDTAKAGGGHIRQNSQPAGLSLLQAAKTRSFWFIFFGWIFFALCINLIHTHFIPYATDNNISNMEAATVLSLMGFCSLISRVVTGRVSDIAGRKVPATVAAILKSAALLWLIWSNNLNMFYVFAVVFGFGWGGFGTSTLALTTDIFGGRSLGLILGALEMGFAIGAAIGPAIGGLAFDVSHSYVAAFAVGAGAMILAMILVTFTRTETAMD